MTHLAEIVLCRRPIEGLAATGLFGPGRKLEHRCSVQAARVPLQPLEAGRHFLENWPARELPDQGLWRNDAYHSISPAIFVAHDALLHSSAGIVALNGVAIAETMEHASPEVNGFRSLARGIAVHPKNFRRVAGAHISLLTGGEGNYYHSMLLSLARLACVPKDIQAEATSVLLPLGAAQQRDAVALLDPMPSLSVQLVGPDETLQVERLILPLSVAGDSFFHPCVAEFFRTMSTGVSPHPGRLPRRLYIDRRGSSLRPLMHEDELVAALSRLGFVAVRPELLSLADQVRLFRAAEVVVAPHGAALTNLGFCRPGTQVIELLMDAYCNWCFRNLAGLMQLRYDCVLGKARKPWRELDAAFHLTPWEISVNHVVAAVAQATEHRVAA